MRFFALPIGLWALSLLVSVSAAAPADPKKPKKKKPPAPPIGTQLTLGDFNQTIARDYWFVEFYSPSCPHCRRFAPTWKEFTEGPIKANPELHFAQVNCLAQGDLCNAQGVKGYPELNFFHDGSRIGQFEEDRLVPKMTAWVEEKIKTHEAESLPPPPPPPKVDSTSSSTSSSAAVEKPTEPVVKDDKLAAQVPTHDHGHEREHEHEHEHEHEYGRHHEEQEEETVLPAVRLPNPTGSVLSLNPDTLPGVVAEGPVFVKFFAPWCGHCKKLAPTWVALAQKMQNKLMIAEVDCDAHQSFCKQQGVKGYPQMFLYSGGKQLEYSGGRSLEPLENYANKAAAPAVESIQYSQFKTALKDQAVFFVYIFQTGNSTLTRTVEEGAKPLVGSPAIYKSSDMRIPQMFSRVHAPAILALKAGKLHATLPLDASQRADSISAWLLAHRLPLALELSPENFQEVMKAPSKPLVVLAAYDPAAGDAERVRETVREVAEKWRDDPPKVKAFGRREVVHVWMDGAKWAGWLKSMYGIAPPWPKVVLVDHSRLIYHDTDAEGRPIVLDKSSVPHALKDALEGTAPVRHSENIVERFVRGVEASFDAGWATVQSNIMLSLVAVGALIVLASVGFRRCLRVDPNVYVPQHGHARLD